jgi:hypothetical protein
MTLEIQIMAWDRNKSVAGLNRLNNKSRIGENKTPGKANRRSLDSQRKRGDDE